MSAVVDSSLGTVDKYKLERCYEDNCQYANMNTGAIKSLFVLRGHVSTEFVE